MDGAAAGTADNNSLYFKETSKRKFGFSDEYFHNMFV